MALNLHSLLIKDMLLVLSNFMRQAIVLHTIWIMDYFCIIGKRDSGYLPQIH
jgi:hypothetical protein